MKTKKKYLPYLLLSPVIAIMTGFVFYPILITFLFSLEKLNLTQLSSRRFIGLDNYRDILRSSSFWTAFQNSIFVLILILIFSLVGGFLLGLFLSKKSKLSGLLLGIAIVPWALPGIVNGILWRFIFYGGYGPINSLLIHLHLLKEPFQWLGNRTLALVIISFITAWRNVPFCGIVFLAAIQAIPKSVIEAAAIDGAGRINRLFHIIIPMTASASKIVFATTAVMAINVFDEVVAISGYRDLTKTLLIENYLTTFSFLDFGKGSALVYIIMIFSAWLGFSHVRNVYRKEEKIDEFQS